ncbi:TonB-dependent receptor [Gilvimarinus japonicus]|uniref:TonB-dependent receptor n=1 Tax=Gilvimarinus japonicus TaxID=1796469 RepID=A0ABV7HZY2_9GAMM
MIHTRHQLVPLLTLASLSTLAFAQQADNEPQLEEMIVTASRTAKPISSIPNTVTVINKIALDQQLAVSYDLSTVLGNLVPGFTPSRQKMTGSGETLRGRSPLYLIDGVPQSNPLRDGSRDGLTLDPAMIERIEVIHGANAVHGMGASGGIINLITKKPVESREQSFHIDVNAPTDYDSDALSTGLGYSFADAFGRWDLAFSASVRDSGIFTDANGDIIGVDTTQGDTMDSESRDFFLKTGYRGDGQSLHLMVNNFNIEGNGDWITVAGDVANGIPTSSEPGTVPGKAPTNDVTTVSLDYRKDELWGHSVHAQLFYQDFAATFGGGTFGTFYDPAYGDNFYDQSQNESEKVGFKLTMARDKIAGAPVNVVWGFDALQDETQQVLVQSGRAWVPPTNYKNIAPYAQLEFTGVDHLVVTGGLRYESSKLDVDDFTTLYSYGSQFVEGGSPSFNETLYNLGFTYEITDALRIFGNVSEGSSMPDVGRVLRGINEPNQSVESFLNLVPIVTDNRELGIEYDAGNLNLEVSYYQSDSDYGSRLAMNADGIFDVKREKTEIDGIEASATWSFTSDSSVGIAYSNPTGEYDSDADGSVDTDLDATNISPERINLFWSQQWTSDFDTRVQASNLLDRDYQNAVGESYADFDGYTLLDITATWMVGNGQLQASVQNLTNEEYITYYSQAQTNNERYFAGRGRTVSLGYTYRF